MSGGGVRGRVAVGTGAVCSICKGTSFEPGPGARLSRRGQPPRCVSCKSLERHRSGRAVFEALRDRELFRSFKLLQFGNDPIVAKGWFASVEVGSGETRGALNPMSIGRPDGSFDCIVSSHIVTRVPDHEAAIVELGRVLSRRGIGYLSYPNPVTRATTEDWGVPRREQSGNYRILGRDFEPVLTALLPKMHVAAVSAADPVTQEEDLVYLLTHDFTWVRRILASGMEFRLL